MELIVPWGLEDDFKASFSRLWKGERYKCYQLGWEATHHIEFQLVGFIYMSQIWLGICGVYVNSSFGKVKM